MHRFRDDFLLKQNCGAAVSRIFRVHGAAILQVIEQQPDADQLKARVRDALQAAFNTQADLQALSVDLLPVAVRLDDLATLASRKPGANLSERLISKAVHFVRCDLRHGAPLKETAHELAAILDELSGEIAQLPGSAAGD